MMNKKYTIIVIIGVLMVLLLASYQNQSDDKAHFKQSYDSLKQDLYRLEELNIDLRADLNEAQTLLGEQTGDINKFKHVLQVFFEDLDNENIRKVLYNIFELNAYIEIDDRQVELPRQGQLFITEDHFTFYASVASPDYADIDFRLSPDQVGLFPLFRSIYCPSTDKSIVKGNELKLDYNNLEIGDRIQFKTTRSFREAFAIESETITVTRVDADLYGKGKDFYVSAPIVVTYFEDDEPSIEYDYYKVEEDRIDIKINELQIDYYNIYGTTVYIRDNAVGYRFHIGIDEIDSNTPLDSILLPSLIIEGTEIVRSENYYAIITNASIEVEVEGHVYECVELTTYYRNELKEVEYYAKGVGLVLTKAKGYRKYAMIRPRISE